MNNATMSADRKERLEVLLSHLEALLPHAEEAPAFRAAMLADPGVDVRFNRLISATQQIAPRLTPLCEPVPWCADALRLPPDLAEIASHSLEFRLGALYLQAKATTLAVSVLDPQPGELVLDLAAAPGGKATQIVGAMGNTGLLLANEPRTRRLASLVGNLERCGACNTLITSVLGAQLARSFHNLFDRVLLDAPCSGDGIVCKDRNMLDFWSPEDAQHKSIQQVGLLRAAFHMLRPGGRLAYSTCSLSTEENEDTLVGLMRRFNDVARIEAIVPLEDGGLSAERAADYPDSFAGAARVWPHHHTTEGGFVAVITKTAATEWDRAEQDLGPRMTEAAAVADAGGWADRIRERWDIDIDVPDGYELTADHRHLHLRHAGAATLADQDWYVRSGMRVAGVHKNDHYFLSQQSVGLWGEQVRQRRLDISWDQVQSLFAGQTCALTSTPPLTGEVIAVHDGLAIGRAVVSRDGTELQSFLPKVARTDRLTRLLS